MTTITHHGASPDMEPHWEQLDLTPWRCPEPLIRLKLWLRGARAGQSLLEDITQKVYQNRNITIPRYILLAPSGEIVCPDLPRPNRYEALAAALASCLEDEGR